MSGNDYAQKRKNVFRIGTGSKALDLILGAVPPGSSEAAVIPDSISAGGGIESGSLTEIAGEYRCGKTQLCHQLCINAQLPRTGFGEVNGGNGKVAYVFFSGARQSCRPN